MNKRKAPGCDGIEVKLWQALGGCGIKAVRQLCSVIWKSRKWLTEWCKSVLIPLHKKGHARLCSNYRTNCFNSTQQQSHVTNPEQPDQGISAQANSTSTSWLDTRKRYKETENECSANHQKVYGVQHTCSEVFHRLRQKPLTTRIERSSSKF